MEHVLWCIGYDLVLEEIKETEGCYLFDSKGQKYLDLESGVWCLPLGHNHPQIKKALVKQISKVSHTGYCYSNQVTEKAAKKILKIVGFNNGKCVFLCSGSEAVEFGVQALREITDRPLLLTLKDSFLGSYGAGQKREDEWYLLDWSLCSSCTELSECSPSCSVFQAIPFDKIGGFVFEPGSSSGLVRFPPKPFIKNLVNIIKENGGYLQINEITTGIGRTGKWFGFQHYDIKPDLVSMGKGLGNGYPVSTIAMTPDIAEQLIDNSFHYSQSHQNDPLGCSVALEVIKVIEEEELIRRCRKLGVIFKKQIIQICNQFNFIKEVRGRGMMIAVECEDNYGAHIYNKLLSKRFIIARRPGLDVLRIDPSFIIKENDLYRFLDTFNQVLKSIQ